MTDQRVPQRWLRAEKLFGAIKSEKKNKSYKINIYKYRQPRRQRSRTYARSIQDHLARVLGKSFR